MATPSEPMAAPPEGEYAYAPPPGPMAAAPRRRGMGPLIAIILVAILVVVAVVAYAGVGYAYAQSRLNSARDSYNAVIQHENTYADAINGLSTKMTSVSLSTASTADLQQAKTLSTQLTTSSQGAASQIDGDDASLAKADSSLKQNQWLTVISRSDIDKASTRIGHLRKALSDAKVITGDYVQLGGFYQTFYDVLLDADTFGNQANAGSLTGMAAAIEKMKTDVAKAISQDKAPGLPADMDNFLKDVQTLANDVTKLLNAAGTGDQAGFDAASAAVQSDGTKVDKYDFTQINNAIESFYKPFIDDYNSEIDKANNT